ncbi:MAG: hypothetical protein B0W54_15490 [Cellvibrio sp. 79]|nr:MAG: hypothetical protein B0W54_15490 [Cellvibrio sp. 79]
MSDPTTADEQWVRLCDDFVNLEAQCALLCELLTCVSRRDLPLDSAGKHGIDLYSNQLREQLIAFKQKLYEARPGEAERTG